MQRLSLFGRTLLAAVLTLSATISVARAEDPPAPAPAPTDTPAAVVDAVVSDVKAEGVDVKVEAATDAAKPAEAVAEVPATPEKQGEKDLLTGITLGDSGIRQIAHILIQRTERAEGKHELTLGLPIQINGKFTEHIGVALDYGYHIREAFAITVGGTFFIPPLSTQSSFTENELIPKAKTQPFVASAILMQFEGHGGLEFSPIYGKFAFMGSGVVQFGLYMGAQAGVAKTQVQLAPAKNSQSRLFGDTGLRPTGVFNVGFRMFVSDFIAIRAEVRDTIYSSKVETINGCTSTDLSTLKSGQPIASGSKCTSSAFGTDVKIHSNTAYELIKDNPRDADDSFANSDILNTLAFSFGFSVLF